MADNKPDFLQNIGDDEESRDLLSAFDEGEPNEETADSPDKTEDIEVQDREGAAAEVVVGEGVGEGVGEKTDDTEKEDNDSEEAGEDGQDKSDSDDTKGSIDDTKKSPDTKDVGKSAEEPKVFGKYKDLAEAEKGYKELESAFGRVNAMLEGYKSGKIPANIPEGSAQLLKMAETPMVKFVKPNVADYTDSDGIMNVDAYMAEYSKNLIVGIQKSLLIGPLAAAQFGILQQAMQEESTSRVTVQRQEMEAEEITTKLYNQFPILKTDKNVEETISSTIIGAKVMREKQAQAKGEKPQPFTYEDYEKIVVSILRNSPTSTNTQVEDKVEKMPAGPTFSGKSKRGGDEMDDIIDGMVNVGNSKQLFLL